MKVAHPSEIQIRRSFRIIEKELVKIEFAYLAIPYSVLSDRPELIKEARSNLRKLFKETILEIKKMPFMKVS